jgi:hypothetical protein
MGETTDPRGARANRRLSLLRGARVARIAECRLEQKMGYGQHTTPFYNRKVNMGVLGARSLDYSYAF